MIRNKRLIWTICLLIITFSLCTGGKCSGKGDTVTGSSGSSGTNRQGFPIITINPSAQSDRVACMFADDEYLYIGGNDFSPGNSQWRLEKRSKATGELVSSFGTNGVITVNPGPGWDGISAITGDTDVLYIAGSDTSPGNAQWRIEKRLKSDGSLVRGFGTAGIVTYNPSAGLDEIYAIITDTDSLYIAGYDQGAGDGATQWRMEKRSKTTGQLVSGFGTGGVITENPSNAYDVIYSMTADADYLYVAGSDQSLGTTNPQWRLEKRSKTDGSLVNGFGTNGIIISNLSSGVDEIRSIIADTEYLYIAGYDQSLGNTQWRLEKRLKSDGSLTSGFGINGVKLSNPSPANDEPTFITADTDALYIGGSDRTYGIQNAQWRLEKRSKTTGELVSEFGSNGAIVINPGPNDDEITCVMVDSAYLYFGGYDQSLGLGNAQWRIEKRSKTSGAQ